jgi:oxygen-dependent protoporphyrinogen oxidase
MKKITIVGGGISGLTVAYALISGSRFTVHGSRFDVTVFEADSRAGGKIWTDKVDGFLCEKGPNGFLDNKPKTLELCENLGIEPLRSNENAKKRYIFSSGKLNLLSESPLSFLKSDLMSWHGKLRMLYELIAPKGPEDETVADFVTRRLGKEALEKLIDPMSSGIFAGDPYKMSIKHCFPRIKELEQEYGSLIRALIKLQKARKKEQRTRNTPSLTLPPRGGGQGWGGDSELRTNDRVGPAPTGNLTSFYNGTQTITDALTERLDGRVRIGVSVKGLARLGGSASGGKKGDSYQLHTSEGIVDTDIVVLATPAYTSAEILKGFDLKLSKVLLEIPYAPVSVVCFGYKREKVLHSLNGFGFLIPHKERRKILGTLWDSSIFPNRAPEGYILLRSMVGGAKSPELTMLDDSALVNTVFDELKPIVSLKAEPDIFRIYRWEKAIPQYELGHGEKLGLIDEQLKLYPDLYLTGNAYRGIGMNDCIENGYKVAEEILSHFS